MGRCRGVGGLFLYNLQVSLDPRAFEDSFLLLTFSKTRCLSSCSAALKVLPPPHLQRGWGGRWVVGRLLPLSLETSVMSHFRFSSFFLCGRIRQMFAC